MRNQNYFEPISKLHDALPDNQMLNLILGAYNEIADLDKRFKALEDRIFAAGVQNVKAPEPTADMEPAPTEEVMPNENN